MIKKERFLRTDSLIIATATILVAAASGVAVCYKEVDDCSVCKKAGANILCSTGGGGAITCPDDIIGTDPPFRKVEEGSPGFTNKRSENYGSCKWQPKKQNPLGSSPPCINDGEEMKVDNVMGEEVYGGPCTSGPPVEP